MSTSNNIEEKLDIERGTIEILEKIMYDFKQQLYDN